ncbi:unnamed protein product [Dracunculus medinensis]|uniref:ACB domain-containing protein n=1 Tax=Dracunculus medinensis TaxID=318479 RepID=A0A0N4UL15_DRAME|nr:unnamed protein product [Dracunculus medinensis]
MPLSELTKKWWDLDFNIAAEEMRRLAKEPKEKEKLQLYGLYKQAVHGDIPPKDDYPIPVNDEWETKKYDAWKAQRGKVREECEKEYVKLAERMIKKYERNIKRSKWNSEVWTVDY